MEERKKNLKAIKILKESLRIFYKNPNFIIFTALTSLPLFLFSLYFQTLLQSFIVQIQPSLSLLLQKPYHYQACILLAYSEGPNSTDVPVSHISTLTEASHSVGAEWSGFVGNMTDDQLREILHLGLLYLAPLNLLRLVTVVLTVDLASKLYREDKELTFKDMLLSGTRLAGERLRGTLVTFLYAVVFSSSTLVGFVWVLLTYRAGMSYFQSSSSIEFYFTASYIAPLATDVWFHALNGSNLVFLFGIYLVWGCIWNLGLVVSVLEGRYGTRALGSSGYLCLRNVRSGMVLMLVFTVSEVGSRVPWWWSSLGGGYEAWALIVAQTGLFCLGNAIKWVGFVVYFDSCIKRLFVKKVDVEQG